MYKMITYSIKMNHDLAIYYLIILKLNNFESTYLFFFISLLK